MPQYARGTVFTQCSLDGFTARANNKFDFFLGAEPERPTDTSGKPLDVETGSMLPADNPPSAAERPDPRFDYDAMMLTRDAVVLGRATFDRLTLEMHIKMFPYVKPTYVVTSRPISKEPEEGEPESAARQREMIKGLNVKFITMPKESKSEVCNVRELCRWLCEEEGREKLFIDGGQLIQSFIRAGMIDDLTVTVAPVIIGKGYPLFGDVLHDVRLELKGTRQNPVNGMLQYRYHVTQTGFDEEEMEAGICVPDKKSDKG